MARFRMPSARSRKSREIGGGKSASSLRRTRSASRRRFRTGLRVDDLIELPLQPRESLGHATVQTIVDKLDVLALLDEILLHLAKLLVDFFKPFVDFVEPPVDCFEQPVDFVDPPV